MPHDFKQFPELTNTQAHFYMWSSPHTQIFEDFGAQISRVIDGDTVMVRWSQRDFDFPVRFSNIAAPEKDELGGIASKNWLKSRVQGKYVLVRIDYTNRVEKWGRLLGTIEFGGMDVGLESVLMGHSTEWERRNEGKIGIEF